MPKFIKHRKIFGFIAALVIIFSAMLCLLYFFLWSKTDKHFGSVIQTEEKKWQNSSILSYTMEVEFHGLHVYKKLFITVKNSKVVEKQETCPMTKEDCADYDLDLIETLFNMAKSKSVGRSRLSKIYFDESYHYPKELFYSYGDNYGEDDADFEIRVLQFTPL